MTPQKGLLKLKVLTVVLFSAALVLPALPAWARQESVSVTFKNNTQGTVRVYWLNNNQEQMYQTLKPGESVVQQTFTNHVWIVRDASDRELSRVTVAANTREILATPSDQRGNPPQAQKTTSLAQTIQLPFAGGLHPGTGYDALTGIVAGRAIVPPTLSGERNKSSHESVQFISSDEDLNREAEASISAQANLDPSLEFSASSSYLNKVRYSDKSTSLVVKYTTTFGYDTSQTFQMQDEAKNLMTTNPAAFRAAYGDYFVAGEERAAQFVAIYRLTANSASELNDFKAKVGAKASGTAEGEAAVKFMQEVSKSKISWSIDVVTEGYTGTTTSGDPWTPERVYEALSKFKENSVGIPVRVELKTYNAVVPTYANKIDIDPDVYVELRRLRANVWKAASMYKRLPKPYRDLLQDRFHAFHLAVEANQSILPTESGKTTREQLRGQGDTLLADLTTYDARRAFFVKLLNKAPGEPATGAGIGGQPQAAFYGYSSYDRDPAAVQIKSETQEFLHDYYIGQPAHWENTFRFGSPTDKRMIVGWQVISMWGDDHNGQWWKASNGSILGTNQGLVNVKGEYARGSKWKVVWYYVDDAKDYRFD
jgi:VHL beta domain